MCNIGVCYKLGHGVPQDDAQAIAWYQRAAAAGNPTARQWLAGHPPATTPSTKPSPAS